jgi:hypothetical protein
MVFEGVSGNQISFNMHAMNLKSSEKTDIISNETMPSAAPITVNWDYSYIWIPWK